MLPALGDICGTDVYDRASNSLRGGDDNVVVLGHLERVQRLLRGGLVQDTDINGLGHGVVDQLAKDETVSTLVEELHGVGRNRETVANIRVAFEHLRQRQSNSSRSHPDR